jgi:hypothetical protein
MEFEARGRKNASADLRPKVDDEKSERALDG